MSRTRYVPILKAKQGELWALKELDDAGWTGIVPLLDVPTISHLEKLPSKLKNCIGPGREFFVDYAWNGKAEEIQNKDGMTFFLEECRTLDLSVVPVVSLNSPGHLLEAVKEACRQDGRGVCVRLTEDDYSDPLEFLDAFPATVEKLGLDFGVVDVVLDLKEIPLGKIYSLTLSTQSFLRRIPETKKLRRLVLASTSFPENLNAVSAEGIACQDRDDWKLWRHIRSLSGSVGRVPIYSDYGIQHPVQATENLPPELIKSAPNLRYTIESQWLLMKARGQKRGGCLSSLCEKLIGKEEFCGADFSWGDAYIVNCAKGKAKQGNAQIWRKIATSHHLAFVVNQLANLDGASDVA